MVKIQTKMEKQLIRKTVFHKYLGEKTPKWKDIKNSFEIEDEDFVAIFYEEDEFGNGEWVINIERDQIESDEAYELRLRTHERWINEQKEKRHKRYIELKEEFEKEK